MPTRVSAETVCYYAPRKGAEHENIDHSYNSMPVFIPEISNGLGNFGYYGLPQIDVGGIKVRLSRGPGPPPSHSFPPDALCCLLLLLTLCAACLALCADSSATCHTSTLPRRQPTTPGLPSTPTTAPPPPAARGRRYITAVHNSCTCMSVLPSAALCCPADMLPPSRLPSSSPLNDPCCAFLK